VLDLDETLVHSGFKPFENSSDIILKIELENRVHDIHVLVRPGAEEFLDRMSKYYELVIFTASLSKVTALLNIVVC
jgi:RNA polymerase II subunit A small phosphatase-like protein